MTADPALLELLRELHAAQARANILTVTLIAEVRGLRVDLAARRAPKLPRALADADVRALSTLLPAVAAVMGAEDFTVRRLTAAALARTPEAKALRAAIAGTKANAPQLGRMFQRAADAGTAIGGLYVHATGAARDGAVICINAEPRDHRTRADIAVPTRFNPEP